jgi:hypothetical protein
MKGERTTNKRRGRAKPPALGSKAAKPASRRLKAGGPVHGVSTPPRPDRRARVAPAGPGALATEARAGGGALLRALGAKTPQEQAGMVLGTPGDVYHMLKQGYRYGVTKTAEALGLIRPDEGEEMRQPDPGDPPLGSAAITKYLQGTTRPGGGGGDGSADDDERVQVRRRGGPLRRR